jgi:hypothetical protein
MGDDGAGVLLEMVPSARPPHAAMPRVHGRRATATNVKRRRTRSCSRRSTRALGATVTGVRDGGDGSYVNHHDVATQGRDPALELSLDDATWRVTLADKAAVHPRARWTGR